MNIFQGQTFIEHVNDVNEEKQEIIQETKDTNVKQSNEEERTTANINSFEQGHKCLEVHVWKIS